MKRRQFQQNDNCCTITKCTTKATSAFSSSSASRQGRIALLPEKAQASVRASQVIGTLPRAIEELVRNSIVHGRATFVDVKLGVVLVNKSKQQQKSRGGFTNRENDSGDETRNATILEVKDNGIGIDSVSCETMIGTVYCSTSKQTNHDGSYNNVNNMNKNHERHKGESLKSLAALSAEFHLKTVSFYKSKIMEEHNPDQNNHRERHLMPLAPSKSRKRKHSSSFHYRFNTSSTQNRFDDHDDGDDTTNNDEVIISEKIITGGVPTSFHSSKCKPSQSPFYKQREHQQSNSFDSNGGTGTTIQLYGLFHGFAVRKRQYEISNVHHHNKHHHHSNQHQRNHQNNSSDKVSLNQARTTIQILALIFPHVSIRLLNNSNVDSAWYSNIIKNKNNNQNDHRSSSLIQFPINPYLPVETHCIRNRLMQLCGEKNISQFPFIDIDYVEGGGNSGKFVQNSMERTNYTNERMSYNTSQWIIQGVLSYAINNDEGSNAVNDKNTSTTNSKGIQANRNMRSKQHEYIFVNGKLSKQNSQLGDFIHSYIDTEATSLMRGMFDHLISKVVILSPQWCDDDE